MNRHTQAAEALAKLIRYELMEKAKRDQERGEDVSGCPYIGIRLEVGDVEVELRLKGKAADVGVVDGRDLLPALALASLGPFLRQTERFKEAAKAMQSQWRDTLAGRTTQVTP